MNLDSLKTSQFADLIKDRIDDLRMTGAIPERLINKTQSFKKLLRAINEADIDLCGYLSPKAQVIVYLPKDYSEIYLRNSDLQAGEYTTQVDSLDIPEMQKAQLLNYDFWTKVRAIDSTYLLASRAFPIGNRTGGKRYKLVPYDEFSDVTEAYRDEVYEEVSPAFYDVHRSRIVLDGPARSDVFVHFMGELIPEKIDFSQITKGSWDDYRITTPEIAESALISCVMHKLMPVGSDIRQFYRGEYEAEKRKAAGRIPVDTSSFTLDSNIGA